MGIIIDIELCDGCGRCVKACPYEAIAIEGKYAVVLPHCTLCTACIEACKKNKAISSDIKQKIVPDFSDRKGVWVFAEQRDGKLLKVSLELLSKACELARTKSQEITALLIGNNVSDISDTLTQYGADSVIVADDAALQEYRTIAYTDVIEELVKEYKPDIFLMGATHIGRDLAPRVSRRIGCGLTADCTELAIDQEEGILIQTRPAFGGNVMASIVNRYSRPQMATVRPGVMEAIKNPKKNAKIVNHAVSLSEDKIGTKILKKVAEGEPQKNIDEAKIIVAGGRGVNGKKGFEMLGELAQILGAEVAGTRIAVENGFVPASNQVGQTGKTVRPDLYIACGISGAIQHRAGIMGSRYILAINNDERSPIFEVADVGIIGDLHEIVSELIKTLKNGVSI